MYATYFICISTCIQKTVVVYCRTLLCIQHFFFRKNSGVFIKIFRKNVDKCLHQNFCETLRKLFSKKIYQETFPEFPEFPKILRRKISGKVFQKIVGNFFVRRPVRKPPKIPPGLFRKTGGLFVRIRFGNGCFLHKFRGKICGVSLRIQAVSRKIPGGISPGIPGNSGGKIRGFFRFFLGFPAATQGWPPKNWGIFGGNSGGNFVKTGKSGKFDRTFSGKFFRKKFRGKFFRNFREFSKIFVRLQKNPGILQNPLCGAGYTP